MRTLTLFSFTQEGFLFHFSVAGTSCINSEAALSPEGVKRADLLGHYPNTGLQLGRDRPNQQ
jgi:hypothetical protein